LVFKANTLDNWKMFWSIWENEIIKKIFEEFGIKLEKKHIEMPNWHIKRIWKNDIFVKLSPDTVAKITVIVE
jgi:ribosomal protein L9